ncbi:ankyrin repeat domain-containing protein [Ruficoccus amylovorans]|uniref:Ankyrin repeat domain-containing protein n=1 Tax=Ruficoccus amylovorans TaxID=1804625 RepID=A0A842HLS4_9BACT|nr:ankyrin repeat domain-containing protein [Ruficoccus amylovorans]
MSSGSRAAVLWTPLGQAARQTDDPAVIGRLVRAGEDPNGRNRYGATALMYAALSNSSVVVIQALIAAGADPNDADDDELTPLMYAAQENTTEVVRALLKAGALPNAQTQYGWTALMAADRGHVFQFRPKPYQIQHIQ